MDVEIATRLALDIFLLLQNICTTPKELKTQIFIFFSSETA